MQLLQGCACMPAADQQCTGVLMKVFIALTFAAFLVLPPPAANSSKCLPSSLSLMTSANLQQQHTHAYHLCFH